MVLILVYLCYQPGFIRDVKAHIERFVSQKYGEIEYNHKMD